MQEQEEYEIISVTKNAELLSTEKNKLDDYFWCFFTCSITSIAFAIFSNLIYSNSNIDINKEDLYNLFFAKALIVFLGCETLSLYGVYDSLKNMNISNKRIRELEKRAKQI